MAYTRKRNTRKSKKRGGGKSITASAAARNSLSRSAASKVNSKAKDYEKTATEILLNINESLPYDLRHTYKENIKYKIKRRIQLILKIKDALKGSLLEKTREDLMLRLAQEQEKLLKLKTIFQNQQPTPGMSGTKNWSEGVFRGVNNNN